MSQRLSEVRQVDHIRYCHNYLHVYTWLYTNMTTIKFRRCYCKWFYNKHKYRPMYYEHYK